MEWVNWMQISPLRRRTGTAANGKPEYVTHSVIETGTFGVGFSRVPKAHRVSKQQYGLKGRT